MTDASPEAALAQAAAELTRRGVRFALVGGLGVSIRGEVRFTRDVDIAVAVRDDAEAERLVHDLVSSGYRATATVEHRERKRLATARLASPNGIVVDLLMASSGIEEDVVSRATNVSIEGAGEIPVARAEELLALKVLSMTDARPQDRIDAFNLLAMNETLDVRAVRELLDRITARGFHRAQDLQKKLDDLLASAAPAGRA